MHSKSTYTMNTIFDAQVGLYSKKSEQGSGVAISLRDFLSGIRSNPEWKRLVEFARAAEDLRADDRPIYERRKTGLPCATLAGVFSAKTKDGLINPSGLMAVDLDHLDGEVNEVKAKLALDPYVVAVFLSVSGLGLCVLFRIQPERYEDAFDGVRQYLIDTYGLTASFDQSSRNVNRLRYISHDPEIPTNENAKLFLKYVTRQQAKRYEMRESFVHTDRDIEYVLSQIEHRCLDLTGGYYDWFRIGWALISAYGEAARDMFHRVSQFHPKYRQDQCDRKFTQLMASRPEKLTIATFYWYCKQHGVDVMSDQTREVVNHATMSKRQKVSESSAVKKVLDMTDANEEEARAIVAQVYASPDEIDTGDTLFDQLEFFLRNNYDLRKNVISRFLENRGVSLLEEHVNDIYIACAKHFEMKVTKDNVLSLLSSSFVMQYNPLKSFFLERQHIKPEGLLDALADTITTDTGLNSVTSIDGSYVRYYVRKFMIGMVASVFEQHCPLMLVLTGPQNTGKTEWFRRLLPQSIRQYYAETKFDAGKDDEILMCKKLLLCNDEFGGQTMKEAKKLKDLTSKQVFTLREPYARQSVDMQRLALLCGTSNDPYILSDPTGNRRIIPINVLSIDHAAYNAIDKDELFMEAYHAWKAGETHHLTREDVERLNKSTHLFEDILEERELIEQAYEPAAGAGGKAAFLSATEVKVILEKQSNLRLGLKRIAQELKRICGKDSEIATINGRSKRGFWLLPIE